MTGEFPRDSERVFSWFVTFSSPPLEITIVAVLTSIMTTLGFYCITESLVSCSINVFTLIIKVSTMTENI